MSLVAGARLGPYQVESAIGAGGMGEVYRARDTRLDRTVAIKVLPSDVSVDVERRARFEREAKTIAGLNHSHICTLYDVGDHDGAMFLVMEHLAGQTLAERLEKGPLPLQQALTIATEIADALSAAHRQGIIHRDLKPGNVMLTKAGSKLLDFGLAKLKAPGGAAFATSLTMSQPTKAPATAAGTLVGTVPYMAPEQLRGREADPRSDIFSFGAVLYEMLAGKRAFVDDSQVGVMVAILEHEPAPLASIQPATTPALDRTIRKCLAKDPEARWQDAGDLRDELRWIADSAGAGGGARPAQRAPRVTLRLVCGALLMAGIGAAAAFWLRPPAPEVRVARVSVDVGPADEMNAGGAGRSYVPPPGSRTSLGWTPDGQSLVFVGRRGGVQRLYVRRLDAVEAQAISGTEGAQVPAISPDGRWVAFWAPNALKKVPIAGGPAMDLVPEVNPPKGLAWSGDGQLYFARVGSGLWRAPASGGSAMALTHIGEDERSQVLSSLLPGDRVLLYTARKRDWTWGDEEVVALDLTTGRRKVLVRDGADARYVPTGHLVFLRRGVLSAVRFDAKRLEPLGGQVPLLDAVSQSLVGLNVDNITGAGQFAVSAGGALAWVARDGVPRYHESVLVSVDRRGQVTELGSPVRMYGAGVRVSPDGRRLAVSSGDLTAAGVWLFEIARAALTPLERAGETLSATAFWSQDGRRVIFGWLHEGRFSLASQLADADGSSPPESTSAGAFTATGWASNRELIGVAGGDLAVAAFEKGLGPIRRLFETPDVVEQSPEVSPDGRWLAYESNAGSSPAEASRFDIYVQRYGGRGRTLVAQGGRSPAWNPNGRELFYVERVSLPAKLRMMAVDFQPGEPPRVGSPRLLFEYERNMPFVCAPARCYDVAPDGQRFYATRAQVPPVPGPVSRINVVFNWTEELKAKTPR